MKRFAGLIVVFVMLLSALPALADETRTSGDFRYTLKSNGTATIVGYTGMGDNIIIPQMLDGYTVTAIGDNAINRLVSAKKTYSSVTLPDTIKSIGAFAFRSANITSINLPDGLEDIGKGAFVGCNSITYRISANHPTFAVIDGALYNKSQKKLIWGKEGATIPEGIKIIGDFACYEVPNCGINRNGIVLPSTIEEIGDYAFYGNHYSIAFYGGMSETEFIKPVPKSNYPCFSSFPYFSCLTPCELKWDSNLQKIGSCAFASVTIDYNNSDAILILSIPSSVSELGEACFNSFGISSSSMRYLSPWTWCGVAISIPKDSQLRSIPARAFANFEGSQKTPLCSIICDAPIVTIGDYAFGGTYIASFNMQNVKTLGKGAFYSTIQGASITIPDGCKIIPEKAFENAYTMGYEIVIPNGVEVIEANALNLRKIFSPYVKPDDFSPIYLPASLTSIAPDAFRDDAEFIVERGSYAYRWAEENARNYSIDGEKQNLDWLNN